MSVRHLRYIDVVAGLAVLEQLAAVIFLHQPLVRAVLLHIAVFQQLFLALVPVKGLPAVLNPVIMLSVICRGARVQQLPLRRKCTGIRSGSGTAACQHRQIDARTLHIPNRLIIIVIIRFIEYPPVGRLTAAERQCFYRTLCIREIVTARRIAQPFMAVVILDIP
ncbi:hypothetical protein D3C75_407230 [compost metagenome]